MIGPIRRILAGSRGGATERLMTSLNMILLAFFIVLNSFAVSDDKKIKKAWGSLLGTLGILTSGLNPSQSEGQQTLPRMAEMTTEAMDIRVLMNELEKFAFEEKLMKDVNLMYGAKGVAISLTNQITFEPGEAELKPVAKEMLIKIGRMLSKLSGTVNIIGHTSRDIYVGGDFPDDWTISFARAGSAARYFVDNNLIKNKRISISGYGATRPLVDNDTPEHIRLNDRLEIVLSRDSEEEEA